MSDTLTPEEFDRLASLAKRRWGLSIPRNKREMVAARLRSHARKSGLAGVTELLERVETDASDDDALVFFDVLSTNVTSFFRDPEHFAYLERELYTPLARGTLTLPRRRLRMWSAACSLGCEPYSMAMQALDLLGDRGGWTVEVLATDLSGSALEAARRGVYSVSMLEHLDPALVQRHFERGVGRCEGYCRIKPAVRGLVRLAQLNLMEPWPAEGPMHVIFCRNVMIYFDLETRASLVARFEELLAPGGVLVLGSAETLSGIETKLRPVQPAVYAK